MKSSFVATVFIPLLTTAACAIDAQDSTEEVQAEEAEVTGGTINKAAVGVQISSSQSFVGALFSRDVSACSRARIVGTSYTIERCPVVDPFSNLVDAGTVTATTEKLTLAAENIGGFFFLGQIDALFEVGDRITLSVSGAQGGAPAFSTRVTLPPKLDLVAPVFTGTDDVFTLDRSNDLDLRWSGDVTRLGGDVSLIISENTTLVGGTEPDVSGAEPAPTHSTSIDCTFDGRAGRARVPARLLSHLRRGEGAAITIESLAVREFNVRGWKVHASASTSQQSRPVTIR